MRAPLAFTLSLLLSAGAAAGNVKTTANRGNAGSQAGSAGSVTPVTLSVPTLNPGLGIGAQLAPIADLSRGLPFQSPQMARGDLAPTLAAPGFGPAPSDAPRAAADAADASVATNLPPYMGALIGAGAPKSLVEKLDAFLAARHPGDQSQVYHGLQHSRDVAGVAARMASESGLSPARTALVVLAASLHDLDPNRAPGAPPTVKATVAYLEQDGEARLLLAQFGNRFGFSARQVAALIKATDFNPNPEALKAIQAEFERSAGEAFAGDVAWALDWGKRLALADKTAAYLGDNRQSLAFVRGLAGEFRAGAEARGEKGPPDVAIVANTHNFMTPLRDSPEFALLPADLQARYDDTLAYFRGIGTPEAAAKALEGLQTSAPTRGPPALAQEDLKALNRYINSIAGDTELSAEQRNGLFKNWLEDEAPRRGIKDGSQRARDVHALFNPGTASTEDAAMAEVHPRLQRQRAALLKLAKDNNTTPKAISDTLVNQGLLGDLRGLGPEAFERQAWFAMRRASLERAVRRYPQNEQGDFMRMLKDAMLTPSGKSVEEVARSGAFAQVTYAGGIKAKADREPDNKTVDMVFYITRVEEKWHIEGNRQNRPLGRSDDELVAQFKAWLLRGGIPAADFD